MSDPARPGDRAGVPEVTGTAKTSPARTVRGAMCRRGTRRRNHLLSCHHRSRCDRSDSGPAVANVAADATTSTPITPAVARRTQRPGPRASREAPRRRRRCPRDRSASRSRGSRRRGGRSPVRQECRALRAAAVDRGACDERRHDEQRHRGLPVHGADGRVREDAARARQAEGVEGAFPEESPHRCAARRERIDGGGGCREHRARHDGATGPGGGTSGGAREVASREKGEDPAETSQRELERRATVPRVPRGRTRAARRTRATPPAPWHRGERSPPPAAGRNRRAQTSAAARAPQLAISAYRISSTDVISSGPTRKRRTSNGRTSANRTSSPRETPGWHSSARCTRRRTLCHGP